jgi:alpha/beta superfamily hydrolase
MNQALPVNRPSLFWLMTEPGRALTELGFSFTFNSLYKNKTKGDGHPVMILPGFMSTKQSTKVLRTFIEKQGYKVYDWGLGRNLGKVEYISILNETLDEIYKKTGQQVSLVGWSLGGVFARQLAKNRPDIVRQVITLGSPFAGLTAPNNVSWVYTVISGGKNVKDTDLALLKNLPIPAPVPTTAIYSKEDGIVPWQACLEKNEDETHQNIQVRGSHIGLGVNPSVLTIIADRLRFTKQNWRYFKPKGLVDNLLFPSL